MFDGFEAKTHIPGDCIELNDLENTIGVDYDCFMTYKHGILATEVIKPFNQEIKNYLKIKFEKQLNKKH